MTDPIARLNAALEGRYRIESELGEGGMATVYLAEDVKHHRNVAIKVLKPELAAVVGADRFLAEIETTANLTHPHILPLHDSGAADGFLFFVIPYIEGDTLRDKIDREKQLSITESVRIAERVAAALDYAHKHGVVHRDIKPGNILLNAEGEPTIADFGIALAVAQAGRGRVTETGLSMGTPSYMSPEQATGDRDVDPRTDVYALGCVLYEMLIGEPPYMGSTAQAILGKIIQGTPVSATAARTTVPPNVDAAIRKALEKLPADRFASAVEFAKALGDPAFRHGEAVAVVQGPGAWRVAAIALGVALAATTAWSLFRPEPPAPPPTVARFSTPFEDGQAPFPALSSPHFTPDGAALIYTGPAPGGQGSQLWIRRWADLEATPIRGTEGASASVASPDGQEVAFTAEGNSSLRIASLVGGPARTILDEPNTAVFYWAPDGMLYYTQNSRFAISRVPASGGGSDAVEVVTETVAGEIAHGSFTLLPGGRMGVFQVWHSLNGEDAEVWTIDMDTRERRPLVSGGSPRYASSGHLLFTTFDGVLMAAPIDPGTADLTGPAVPVADGLGLDPLTGTASYAVSAGGTLIFARGSAGVTGGSGAFELAWVTRTGEVTPVDPTWRFDLELTAPSGAWGVGLSPDGSRAAVSYLANGNTDIWVKELPDEPPVRATVDDQAEGQPFWSPDGQSLTYVKGVGGESLDIWRGRPDGTGTPELILDADRGLQQPRWSPDGSWLVMRTYQGAAAPGVRDLVGFRPGVDSTLVPLIATPEFAESDPAISPDGRWLAYTSNRSGRDEVYVSPFPDVGSSRVQASTDGGAHPVWAHSGRELFMATPGGLVSAQVATDPTFRVLQRETLFPLSERLLGVVPGADMYAVAPDDQRFVTIRAAIGPGLMNQAVSGIPRYVLVQNFFEVIRERVGER